jgi:hypothetical protein
MTDLQFRVALFRAKDRFRAIYRQWVKQLARKDHYEDGCMETSGNRLQREENIRSYLLRRLNPEATESLEAELPRVPGLL